MYILGAKLYLIVTLDLMQIWSGGLNDLHFPCLELITKFSNHLGTSWLLHGTNAYSIHYSSAPVTLLTLKNKSNADCVLSCVVASMQIPTDKIVDVLLKMVSLEDLSEIPVACPHLQYSLVQPLPMMMTSLLLLQSRKVHRMLYFIGDV